jgi:radical SAM superfamily enzyme YgiQ (UPF0313 family)
MNITLINANTIKPPLSPVGVLYIAAYLKSQGLQVHIVDIGMEKDIPSALDAVAKQQPGLIGISIRNIDSAQMRLNQYFLPGALAIVRAVRDRFHRIPVVLGGAGFSLAPHEIMRLSGADYGIIGEGEGALHELIKRLQNGQAVESVAGLIYKADPGHYTANRPRNAGPEFFRNLPFQDIESVDYAYYYNSGGMASLQTKRGCALDCTYCTYPLVEGKYYRLLPPSRIVDEMEYFISKGFDYFHFTDSVFNVPRTHAVAVCREIIKRNLAVKWHTYMSPQDFDDELAECLAAAGNDGILFGVDSCSGKMLRALAKNFCRQDIARAVAACRKNNLEFSFHILFGAPGETMESVEETLRAIDEWRPTAAFLTQGIRIYRDTPIHRKLVQEGKLDADHPLLEPYFYLSEALPQHFSQRIHDFAVARDFVFSDTTVKSPSTNEAVMALYKRNFRGPCWKILTELKRLAATGNPERAVLHPATSRKTCR